MWTVYTALVMDTLERECCVRGYHVMRTDGKLLLVKCWIAGEIEPNNANDHYAMAVVSSKSSVAAP